MRNKEKLSDIFEDAFQSSDGGSVRDCHCGITYFDDSADGHWDWEKGEREELQRKAREIPTKVIALDWTVCTLILDGIEYVIGCECTSELKRYEDFFIRNGRQIAGFLNRRGEELLRDAEMEAKNTTVKIPT